MKNFLIALNMFFIIGAIIVYYYNKNKEVSDVIFNQKDSIYDLNIKRIEHRDSILSLYEEKFNTLDSVANIKIVNITNNYKYIYEKTNDSTFNDFIPIINLLLKRHDTIKFEKSY